MWLRYIVRQIEKQTWKISNQIAESCTQSLVDKILIRYRSEWEGEWIDWNHTSKRHWTCKFQNQKKKFFLFSHWSSSINVGGLNVDEKVKTFFFKRCKSFVFDFNVSELFTKHVYVLRIDRREKVKSACGPMQAWKSTDVNICR
jgi:hypothetical protein